MDFQKLSEWNALPLHYSGTLNCESNIESHKMNVWLRNKHSLEIILNAGKYTYLNRYTTIGHVSNTKIDFIFNFEMTLYDRPRWTTLEKIIFMIPLSLLVLRGFQCAMILVHRNCPPLQRNRNHTIGHTVQCVPYKTFTTSWTCDISLLLRC